MSACYLEEPLGDPGAGKEGPSGKPELSVGRWPAPEPSIQITLVMQRTHGEQERWNVGWWGQWGQKGSGVSGEQSQVSPSRRSPRVIFLNGELPSQSLPTAIH